MGAPDDSGVVAITLALEFKAPAGALSYTPTLMVRVRDHLGVKSLAGASVGEGARADCEVVRVEAAKELVVVRPTAAGLASKTVANCTLHAKFE